MTPARVGIALLFGAGVFGVALLSALQTVPGMITSAQWRTQAYLEEIERAIAEFRQEHGAPPRSLSELRELEDPPHIEKDGQILDGWWRPFIYSSRDGGYSVASLGRDGQPGGVGLDCDLSNASKDPPESRVTLSQFLFELPTGGVVFSCAVAGALAFALGVVTLRRPDPVESAAGLVVVALGAVLASSFMVALHVSKH